MNYQWTPNSDFKELYRDSSKTPKFEALTLRQRLLIREELRFGSFPTLTLSQLGYATSPKAAQGGGILIRPSATNGRSTSAGRWLRDSDVEAALAYSEGMEREASELRARQAAEQEPILQALREAKEAVRLIKEAKAQERQDEEDARMAKRRARMRPKALSELAKRPEWTGSRALSLPAGPALKSSLPAIDDVRSQWSALGVGPWSKAPAEIREMGRSFSHSLQAPAAKLTLRELSENTTAALIGARMDACRLVHGEMAKLLQQCDGNASLEFLAALSCELERIASKLECAEHIFPKLEAIRKNCAEISCKAHKHQQLLSLLAIPDMIDMGQASTFVRCEEHILAKIPQLKNSKPHFYAKARWGGLYGAVRAAFDRSLPLEESQQASAILASAAQSDDDRPALQTALALALPTFDWLAQGQLKPRSYKPFGALDAFDLSPSSFASQGGSKSWFASWRQENGGRFDSQKSTALARAYLTLSASDPTLPLPESGVAGWCLRVGISIVSPSSKVGQTLCQPHASAATAAAHAFDIADLATKLGAFGGIDAASVLAKYLMSSYKGELKGMHPKVFFMAEQRHLASSRLILGNNSKASARRL